MTVAVLAGLGRRSAIYLKSVFTGMKPDKLLLLSVLAGACLAVVSAARLARVPYQIDYGEGLVLEGALRLHHSQPLYPSPLAFPVVLHEYGPVAYAAVASALPGGAVSFPAGRVLIIVCCVLLSLLLSCMLRHLTGSWRIGVAFGLLLLALPAFRFWLYLLRADVIGIVLSVTGSALYVWKTRLWGWSILFFGLAVFCKYTLIAAPLAVSVHLIANRQWKRGIGFAAAQVMVCSLAFAALQAATAGWFAFHMFSTHSDPYSVSRFLALGALVWASAPVVTALALWCAVRDFGRRPWSFPSIYLVTSFITAFTAGKLGSSTNHFLEWMVASCMCAGLGYSIMMSERMNKVWPATFLLSVSVVVGVLLQNRPSLQPSRDLRECGRAYQYVRDSGSTAVLSENVGPVLAAEKPVLLSDPFAYFQMVRHGWPDQQVEERVKQRFFGLIIRETDPSQMKLGSSETWPEPFVEAMQQNYKTVARFSCRGAAVMLKPIRPSGDTSRPTSAPDSRAGFPR